jgi:restriction endonuclease S subunit
MTRDAGVGKSAILKRAMAVSQHFMAWACGPQLDNRFLYYWLQSNKPEFERIAIGNTIKTIGLPYFRQLEILKPPVGEQQAIAEALSDTDALIESLSLLLAKKRQIKQGAMQELLTGKKRLPGFVDSWGSETIGSFTDCTTGGTPSTNIETYWGGDIPWMSSGELHLKHVKDVEGRITDEGLRNSSTKWIPAGCVLIGLAGQGKTRGTVAMNHVPLCTNQSIAAIFPVDSYDSLFLYFSLESRYEELRELSAGDGGRGGLNLSLIRNLAVPMPCLIEQREIARVLADIDSDVTSVEEKLAKARDIKQGMMQALLTGRIRLVQPASSAIPLLTKPAPIRPSSAQATHNWQINEAVVIGVLAQRFGSDKMPLGRKRRAKLTYLLHRHAEGRADGYLKKAAGPYDPNTKYKGPEQIALKNGYVRALGNGTYEGFIAGDKVEQAQRYFEQWYGAAALEWLERFHYRKTDDLELLATVDMAMVDLAANGEPADVASVKRIIAAHPEWLPKLSRELFSDECIAATIAECQTLFGG